MNDLDTLILRINDQIINPFIALLFVVATVLFIYGLVRYFIAENNDEGRSTGKQIMIWGIVGMFIMISVFGIMRLIIGTFDINTAELGIDEYRMR